MNMACNVAACQHEPTANIKMKEKANWMAKSTRAATKHERIRDIQKVWPHTYQLCTTLICLFTAFFTRMYCIECQTRYKTLILQYIRFHTTKTHKHTAQLYRGVSVAAAMGSNKHVKGAESRNVRGGKRRARARTHTPKIGQRYRDTADSREVYRMTVTMFFIYFICLFACLLFV